MSRLLTPRDYRREIASLDQIIEVYGEPEDVASELALEAYVERRRELQEELEELGDARLPGHELDVVLSGEPVRQNAIEADFLGTVLGDLQRLVRSLIGASHGKTEKQVRLGPEIEDAGRLRLSGTFAGSFGMHLEAIREQPDFPAFSPVAEAFQLFIELLEAPEQTSTLLEKLAPIGSRATRHYRDLLKHLNDQRAGIAVEWPSVSGPRQASLPFARTARVIKRLQQVRETEYGKVIQGHLYLGNDRDNKFGIETDTGGVYEGSVSPDLLADLVSYFGKDCRAYVKITEVEDTVTQEVKRFHRLLELAGEDEMLPHEREPEG